MKLFSKEYPIKKVLRGPPRNSPPNIQPTSVSSRDIQY